MLKTWNWFEKIWFVSFCLIGIALSVFWGESWISLIAFVSGIACVVLCAKGSVLNYPIGVLNVALYAWIAFSNRIFGDAILNAFYFFPMQFIGWYMWSKHINKETNEVQSIKLNLKQIIVIFALTLGLIVCYQQFLIFLGGVSTFFDATSTVVSIVAMYLMNKRIASQWELWIVVNIASIIMWIPTGDWIMVLMWTAYLINAFYGWYKWNYKLNKNSD